MCSVSALIMAERKYKTLSSVVSFLFAYSLTEEKDRFVLEWRLEMQQFSKEANECQCLVSTVQYLHCVPLDI